VRPSPVGAGLPDDLQFSLAGEPGEEGARQDQPCCSAARTLLGESVRDPFWSGFGDEASFKRTPGPYFSDDLGRVSGIARTTSRRGMTAISESTWNVAGYPA
jgi:hypothetical protein